MVGKHLVERKSQKNLFYEKTFFVPHWDYTLSRVYRDLGIVSQMASACAVTVRKVSGDGRELTREPEQLLQPKGGPIALRV